MYMYNTKIENRTYFRNWQFDMTYMVDVIIYMYIYMYSAVRLFWRQPLINQLIN